MEEAVWSIAALSGLLVFSQLSPGPDVILVFRTALARGFRGGIAVGSGISLGFAIQAAIACTLGAWVMQLSLCTYLLWAAAAWLLYLAWKIFPKSSSKTELQLADERSHTPYTVLLWQGFLCNILNPKCMLFILTLSAGSIKAHSNIPWYTAALIIAFTAAGWLGWALWSALLQWAPLRRQYLRHTRVIDAVFALLLAGFAVLLLAA